MQLTVRNYHLDGYGHVNNARYLEFLEEARWAFMEKQGLIEQLGGIILIVARADIRYRRPAVEGDVLQFECRLKDIGRRHMVLAQTILLLEGKRAVEAEITLIPVSTETRRTAVLPASLTDTLKTNT